MLHFDLYLLSFPLSIGLLELSMSLQLLNLGRDIIPGFSHSHSVKVFSSFQPTKGLSHIQPASVLPGASLTI